MNIAINLTRLSHKEARKLLENMDITTHGRIITEEKMHHSTFALTLNLPQLLILKQDALSCGCDLATPKGAILGKVEQEECLLVGSKRALLRLCEKLERQGFGLRGLALDLKAHLNQALLDSSERLQIMAILNCTDDSFYEKSRLDSKMAIERTEKLLQKEVDIIDIGAASSRPGARLIDSTEEMERLRDLLMFIKNHALYEIKRFSIDTYNPDTARFALDCGFHIVNDVSGLANLDLLKALDSKSTYILMHTRGRPDEMSSLSNYGNMREMISEIDRFFYEKLELLADRDVILDIGFGFAKNPSQNIYLLNNLSHFKKFQKPLLLGLSRKSTLQKIINKDAKEALHATIVANTIGVLNGANILRVHDTDSHIDLAKVLRALHEAS